MLARHQIALPIGTDHVRISYPLPADPGYWAAMTNWDGQWYRVIAEQGYPATLPRAADGTVDMNPWAFFPVFPLLTAGIMKVTGLPFIIAGPLLSTVLGLLAMWALFRLVDRAVGRFEAIVAVVATCFYMASPVFSASYSESAGPAPRRRHPHAAPGPPLRLGGRWPCSCCPSPATSSSPWCRSSSPTASSAGGRATRASTPSGCGSASRVMAAYAAALTFLWPAIVGIATGVPDGYNETMLAWKIQTKIKLYMWWNLLYVYYGLVGQILGVLGVAAFAWFMLSRHSWRWGPEIWGWAGAYPAYIILVTSTTPSRIRYGLLAFPMTLIIAWFIQLPWLRRWRWWLLAAIVSSGAVQMWWWTEHYLIISQRHRRPLPLIGVRRRSEVGVSGWLVWGSTEASRTSRRRPRRAARAAAAGSGRRRCGGRLRCP